MRDIPVIFSAPMVLALLREIEKPGTGKTMTRRLAWRPAKKGEKVGEGSRIQAEGATPFVQTVTAHLRPSSWQKVEPGDRLWPITRHGARPTKKFAMPF